MHAWQAGCVDGVALGGSRSQLQGHARTSKDGQRIRDGCTICKKCSIRAPGAPATARALPHKHKASGGSMGGQVVGGSVGRPGDGLAHAKVRECTICHACKTRPVHTCISTSLAASRALLSCVLDRQRWASHMLSWSLQARENRQAACPRVGWSTCAKAPHACRSHA